MKLGNLVSAASFGDRARVVGDADAEIGDLAYDSRKAGPGTLFFCVVGEKRDGHEFAAAVVEAGASALVVERVLDVAVPQVVVPSARAAMAPFAAAFEAEGGRRDRHQRQDDHRLPGAGDPRSGRHPDRADGDG
jgi:UDP-N-acetylmuramyl pentapeptide synthase